MPAAPRETAVEDIQLAGCARTSEQGSLHSAGVSHENREQATNNFANNSGAMDTGVHDRSSPVHGVMASWRHGHTASLNFGVQQSDDVAERQRVSVVGPRL